MASYVKTFFRSFLWGTAEGTAEGLTGAHVNTGSKTTEHTEPTNKSKSKSKSTKSKSKSTKSKARFEKFSKKHARRGLRPGDKSRTHPEKVRLYQSIPSDIRRSNDAQLFWNFVDNREFGHQKSYSQGGDSSVHNMLWQDSRSNKRLGANQMDISLKNKIKQQNKYFANTGRDSDILNLHIDQYFDEKKNKKKKLRKRKQSKKRNKNKTTHNSSNKVSKGIKIATEQTGHIVVGKIGNTSGKKLGKAIGKKIAEKTGKKIAEKVGKKALKVIPILGAFVGAAFAAKTIYDRPYSPWSYVSATSDVVTGFFGIFGTAADVIVQTACVVMDE